MNLCRTPPHPHQPPLYLLLTSGCVRTILAWHRSHCSCSWRNRLLIDCRCAERVRVPKVGLQCKHCIVSCLTLGTLPHSFSIVWCPIHLEFCFLSVKLPNYLKMFQSLENASLPSFLFSRRQNLSSKLRRRPRFSASAINPTNSSSFLNITWEECSLVKGKTNSVRLSKERHWTHWNLNQRKILRIQLDCKTVRIFAYSSTREQSNKRSGTRLKILSWSFAHARLLRHALPISLLILRKKNPTVLQSTIQLKIYLISVNPAMLTMTMIFNLRDQLFRGLKEFSDIYEVFRKNSEVHVRVM